MRESTERDFEAYGKLLENVSAFKYLVRVIKAGYDDWPAVAGNMLKVRKSWVRLSRILCREGAYVRVSGNLFQGGGTGGVAVRGGDVGTYPEDGAGPR